MIFTSRSSRSETSAPSEIEREQRAGRTSSSIIPTVVFQKRKKEKKNYTNKNGGVVKIRYACSPRNLPS